MPVHIPPQEKLFQHPTPLFEDLYPSQVMCRHVPRKKETNKLLNVIRTKCLRDIAIPFELKYEQERSPYFRGIYAWYEHLASGTLPSKSRSARSVIKKQSEQILLFQGTLFKIDLDKAWVTVGFSHTISHDFLIVRFLSIWSTYNRSWMLVEIQNFDCTQRLVYATCCSQWYEKSCEWSYDNRTSRWAVHKSAQIVQPVGQNRM